MKQGENSHTKTEERTRTAEILTFTVGGSLWRILTYQHHPVLFLVACEGTFASIHSILLMEEEMMGQD